MKPTDERAQISQVALIADLDYIIDLLPDYESPDWAVNFEACVKQVQESRDTIKAMLADITSGTYDPNECRAEISQVGLVAAFETAIVNLPEDDEFIDDIDGCKCDVGWTKEYLQRLRENISA